MFQKRVINVSLYARNDNIIIILIIPVLPGYCTANGSPGSLLYIRPFCKIDSYEYKLKILCAVLQYHKSIAIVVLSYFKVVQPTEREEGIPFQPFDVNGGEILNRTLPFWGEKNCRNCSHTLSAVHFLQTGHATPKSIALHSTSYSPFCSQKKLRSLKARCPLYLHIRGSNISHIYFSAQVYGTSPPTLTLNQTFNRFYYSTKK